jgi:hypothetical protein
MPTPPLARIVTFVAAMMMVMPSPHAALIAQSRAAGDPVVADVEDIYMGRSWRESRQAPTDFCAPERSGLGRASVEDTYTFRSIEVRGSDGLVVNANVAVIGSLRACFGPLPEVGSFFYAQGKLGEVPFTGRGECRTTRREHPEAGMSAQRCFMELSGLPPEYPEYVGGQLTTNTIGTRNALGDRTDPPGYTQPSIATIRLWKRR